MTPTGAADARAAVSGESIPKRENRPGYPCRSPPAPCRSPRTGACSPEVRCAPGLHPLVSVRGIMTRTTYTAVTALIVSLLTNVRYAHAQTLRSSNDRHSNVNAKGGGHLGVDSTVGEILRHPAFAGFSRLILPWDDRDYEEQMPLSRIASLLPYHSHVDPETVTNALNRMIDDAARGQTVFYSFYTETQQKQQPARKNTGLFFFRGRTGAPFAVISPGGGFSTSVRSTKAFRTPRRSAARDTTHSCSVTAQGTAARSQPRIWRLRSHTFFTTRRRWVSAPVATRCGEVRLERGWRPRSVRMERRDSVGVTFPGRRPLSWRTRRIRITRPPSPPRLLWSASRTALLRRPPWKEGCSAAQVRHGGGVSEVRESRSRIRPRHRHDCRGMGA